MFTEDLDGLSDDAFVIFECDSSFLFEEFFENIGLKFSSLEKDF